MKPLTSIKTRITIWYTTLMFVLIAVVLLLVGALSYRLSIDNIEKDVTLKVTKVAEELSRREGDIFSTVENNKEFKNVSIYTSKGEYIVGQYIYDIANISFKNGVLRRETVDGKEYIVYDSLKFAPPGFHAGFWVRGAESVNSALIFGRSAIIIVLLIVPLIILLAALGGYYITKKAFLPINNIVKTADKISLQSNICERIKINDNAKKDELYDLSVTLNNMLDKIELLIRKEQQFTSDASHELRTPISVILAQGEYMLDIAETEKEKELAENIVTKAKQISKLVSRLLLIARIDQSRQKLNKEKVDLGVIADISFDGLSKIAESKNISLVNNISDGVFVYADEALLLSAINNLVSNAIKYGKQDGYVKISAEKCDNEKTAITVEDNGIGIPTEHLSKIWSRFYRIDDVRNDEYGSSGLGLSVVKSIVKLHNGDIFVDSKLDNGTKFVIIL